MKPIAFRARVFVRKWLLKGDHLFLTLALPLLKLRYHLLCFKHFGWRRFLIFLLEVPDHLRAVFVALFTQTGLPESNGEQRRDAT